MNLVLDPDRLFPAEPSTRAIARDLYAAVADLAIISPHGHVAPSLLRGNEPFGDPAELFLTYDHYITRLLHASGVDLARLGVGKSEPVDPRAAWRILCEHWDVLLGTASGYWLTHEFVTLFGIDVEPAASTADAIYDRIAERLGSDAYRPRALFKQFNIEVLATTDDPLDDLADHAALAADQNFTGRVIPTFRPDPYLNAHAEGFAARVEALTATVGKPADDFAGYIEALEARRAYFVSRGAVSADHGVATPLTVEMTDAECAALYRRAVAGDLDAPASDLFQAAMLVRMAGMSVRDGLVMTIHPGVFRNHSSATFSRFGPDTGHDIPTRVEYTNSLRPLLERYGLEPGLHLVLFGVDETMYSREVAPLAGFYPSVFIGTPWWFIDAPDAIQRFREATTETAGFTRGSGFIDDTRAFLSIPARHDMARRGDAAFLARFVREGRLTLAQAERIVRDISVDLPKRVFKL